MSSSYHLEHSGNKNYRYHIFGSQFGSIASPRTKSTTSGMTFENELEDRLPPTQVYINADAFMYRNLMHRSMHWIYLLYIMILYCRCQWKKWLRKLHDEIKDDKYLVDMELNNVP